MAIKKITCKHATDLITRQEEKPLGLQQRLQLMRHLATCSLCRLFSKQNKWLNTWLQSDKSVPEKQLAADEKQAMIAAMQAGDNPA
jgi:predicted anti-sigma-YlaC factor YlaD